MAGQAEVARQTLQELRRAQAPGYSARHGSQTTAMEMTPTASTIWKHLSRAAVEKYPGCTGLGRRPMYRKSGGTRGAEEGPLTAWPAPMPAARFRHSLERRSALIERATIERLRGDVVDLATRTAAQCFRSAVSSEMDCRPTARVKIISTACAKQGLQE